MLPLRPMFLSHVRLSNCRCRLTQNRTPQRRLPLDPCQARPPSQNLVWVAEVANQTCSQNAERRSRFRVHLRILLVALHNTDPIAAHEHQGIDCSRQHMPPRGRCQMSAHQDQTNRQGCPTTGQDRWTEEIEIETPNRRVGCTPRPVPCARRPSIPHPAFRVVSFHLAPFAFCGCPRAERRGAGPIAAALGVMVVSVVPLGSVPEPAMAAMAAWNGCHGRVPCSFAAPRRCRGVWPRLGACGGPVALCGPCG